MENKITANVNASNLNIQIERPDGARFPPAAFILASPDGLRPCVVGIMDHSISVAPRKDPSTHFDLL